MRKYDVNEINLRVDQVEPFVFDEKISGVVISWSSDIGFGQYTLRTAPAIHDPNDKVWLAETECMDNNEDQSFGRKLLELWMDKALVIE